MVAELQLTDTFNIWRDKFNELVTAHVDSVENFDDLVESLGVVGAFTFDPTLSTGRTLVIKGGNVRNGSVVEAVANTTFTLPASSTRIIAILKVETNAPSLQMYTQANLPDKEVIPVGIFTTNATQVTTYTDLRTEFSMSSGSAGTASSVLQFDKIIERSLSIPATKNGLSVGPTVPTGITVTIEQGATWVIL